MSNKFAKAAVRIQNPNDPESTLVINREDYNAKIHGEIIQQVQNDRGEKGQLQTGTVSRGTVGERESAKVTKKKRSKKKRTKKTVKA